MFIEPYEEIDNHLGHELQSNFKIVSREILKIIASEKSPRRELVAGAGKRSKKKLIDKIS
jgi:hypothetical protein